MGGTTSATEVASSHDLSITPTAIIPCIGRNKLFVVTLWFNQVGLKNMKVPFIDINDNCTCDTNIDDQRHFI